MMFSIGFACRELNFDRPISQGGFAARTRVAVGSHDPIEVRALAIGDTVLVVADVTGLDRQICDEVAAEIALPRRSIVVAATHTHSGPAFVDGGLGLPTTEHRANFIATCAEAVAESLESREDRQMLFGDADALPFATDRRRGGLRADAHLQVLHWFAGKQQPAGWLLIYPCHPTVLGPDNLLLSADYPGQVRRAMAKLRPGDAVIFATGFAGDINAGHSVADSFAAKAAARRTFSEAARIGEMVADAAIATPLFPLQSTVIDAQQEPVEVSYAPLDPNDGLGLAATWRSRQKDVSRAEAAVLQSWIDWASRPDAGTSGVWRGSTTAFAWGDCTLLFLPGEPFLGIQGIAAATLGTDRVLCIGYSNGCPGYFPSADAYDEGGYEVADAHRYYGMPAPFTRGSAEKLISAAVVAAHRLRRR